MNIRKTMCHELRPFTKFWCVDSICSSNLKPNASPCQRKPTGMLACATVRTSPSTWSSDDTNKNFQHFMSWSSKFLVWRCTFSPAPQASSLRLHIKHNNSRSQEWLRMFKIMQFLSTSLNLVCTNCAISFSVKMPHTQFSTWWPPQHRCNVPFYIVCLFEQMYM